MSTSGLSLGLVDRNPNPIAMTGADLESGGGLSSETDNSDDDNNEESSTVTWAH
jgi:hypothetical protein